MLEQIKEEFKILATEQQKQFNEKLIPTALPILGVRIPEIKKIAKRICKEDYTLFLREYDASSFELQMLYGYVLAFAKMDLEERIDYLRFFVPTIQDWAICDGIVAALKCTKYHQEAMLKYLMEYENSSNEFEIRFVVIMLMSYFLSDIYVDRAFIIVQALEYKTYYAKMGVAWFIATAMIQYKQKAFDLLRRLNNKEITIFTIRKVRDSYRISDELKNEMLQFKKQVFFK